ncbi:MAG TPA: cytochrome c oxidase subunit 3 [Vicinamibacterales bacterium]|nr:cytochrome c oxidase subunit 3 [Vicinamibacterales bacterium]
MNARALLVETPTVRDDQLKLGLWMFLATVTMLFAAFTSAYVVRRSGSDWHPVALPSILWINSGVLGVSSIAVEFAHARGARGRWKASAIAILTALVLGVAFLGGQLLAWRQMAAAGVYLPTNPHSAFFFMMTGAHAVHVVAALVVLAWGAVVTVRAAREPRGWAARMGLCRTFWHYLGAMWVFLFALVSLY